MIRKTLLYYLVACAISIPSVWAISGIDEKIDKFSIFKIPPNKQGEILRLPNNFSAVAKINFYSDKQYFLSEQTPLVPVASDSLPRTEASILHSNCGVDCLLKNNNLATYSSWMPALGWASAKSLYLYDSLWIDYSSISSGKSCSPGIRLNGKSQVFGLNMPPSPWVGVSSNSHYDQSPMVELLAPASAFKPKEFFFGLRRFFHLEPDSNWRYLVNGAGGIVQKRMHVNMANAGTLDFLVSNGVKIENVNIRVSEKDNFGEGNVIELLKPSYVEAINPGSTIVKFDFREALKTQKPNYLVKLKSGQNIYLQEVIVFISGSEAKSTLTVPQITGSLISVNLGRHQQSLPTAIHQLTLNLMRAQVDFRGLFEEGVDATIDGAILSIPYNFTNSCDVKIKSIRLVRGYNGEIPVYAKDVSSFTKSLGGPFKDLDMTNGEVEYSRVVGYLPIDNIFLRSFLESGDPLLRDAKNNKKDRQRSQFYSGEASYKVFHDSNQVLDLEVDWPINASIEGGSRIHWSTGKGSKSNTLEATLITADGRRLSYALKPDSAVQVVSRLTNVVGIKFRARFENGVAHTDFGNIVLFTPTTIDYDAALYASFPRSIELSPTPLLDLKGVNQGDILISPGGILGLIRSGSSVSFSTSIKPNLQNATQIDLEYKVGGSDLDFESGEDYEILMNFKWENGATTKKVSLNRGSKKLFLPISHLGPEASKDIKSGALKSIHWTIVSMGRKDSEGHYRPFSLKFTIRGWNQTSAFDDLQIIPVFQSGEEKIYIDPNLAGKNLDPTKGFNPFTVSLPLQADAIERLIGSKDDSILINKNKLFYADQIDVLSGDYENRVAWPISEPGKSIFSKLSVVIFWAIIIVGMALVTGIINVKRVLYDRIYAMALFHLKKIYSFVALISKKALFFIAVLIGPYQLYISFTIVSIVIITLIILSVRYYGGFEGYILLIAGAQLVYGAYRKFSKRKFLLCQKIDQGLLIFTTCLTFFALGKYGLTSKLLWICLPWAAIIYLNISTLSKRLITALPRFNQHAHILLWLLILITLYIAGAKIKVGDGVNYPWVIADLLVINVLRLTLLSLEIWAKNILPTFANYIYRGAGSIYFMSALLCMCTMVILILFKMVVICEQLAIITYFCLILGVVKELIALRRDSSAYLNNQNERSF